MSPKKALKLLSKSITSWLEPGDYEQRYNLYVWQEGVAYEYKDLKYKREKRKLKNIKRSE